MTDLMDEMLMIDDSLLLIFGNSVSEFIRGSEKKNSKVNKLLIGRFENFTVYEAHDEECLWQF